jgi:hypothetical protein
LITIFPEFIQDHTTQDLEASESEGIPTFHSVMMPFTQYFGTARGSITPEQLRALASLVNQAVSLDDDLENAVSTCFLEHLRQIRSFQTLAPFLSQRAREKSHA